MPNNQPTSNFQRLLELSQDKLERSSEALKLANQSYQQAQQQLQQLKGYHLEYTNRLNQESQKGFSIANYRNFHRFINTLETAISEQNSRLQTLSSQRMQVQQQWQALRQRCQAYETLIERQNTAARLQADKLEQRNNDELATQLFFRAKAPTS